MGPGNKNVAFSGKNRNAHLERDPAARLEDAVASVAVADGRIHVDYLAVRRIAAGPAFVADRKSPAVAGDFRGALSVEVEGRERERERSRAGKLRREAVFPEPALPAPVADAPVLGLPAGLRQARVGTPGVI